MENSSKLSVVEALILASPEPLPARKLAEMVRGLTPSSAGKAVAELNNRYMQAGCSFRVREVAGGFQFYVVPEFAGYVQELFARRRKMRLTRASLETLAIVAYRQPVTKAEIEHVRGVATDGVVHNLLQKKLITIRGRAKTVGKPLQYGTTDEFLKFFGLATLGDLPKMSEIEELIAEHEPKSQTQLELAQPSDEEAAVPKLNVADGTYEPVSDDMDEPTTEHTAESDGEPVSQEPEPVVDETVVVSPAEGLEPDSDVVAEDVVVPSVESDADEPDELDNLVTPPEPSQAEELECSDRTEAPVSVDNAEIEDAVEDETSSPVIVDMDTTG
ncbi:MAG: SMC-Scp complex subunit ScpB [candidate division Zixibacteria bacterium]|nr:SMC-Scp complex subunit ScpB [candidate division Zixibacteria bacterium]MDH3938007.1 SMC-Scp complex subunit ScpB [candidate division Zixibacteria bacterium]MDH4032353.1 SMC-Scp complex subunit ScpB [candidate division Zixibacteria bacterium]